MIVNVRCPAMTKSAGGSSFSTTAVERAEKLEQLRALEHGLRFGIARLSAPALPGIDTLDDLRRAEAHWQETQGVTT